MKKVILFGLVLGSINLGPINIDGALANKLQREYNKITVTDRFVCQKAISYAENMREIYYIRTCENSNLEVVSRCTYIRNEVGQVYIKEEENKWCNREK